MRPDLGHCPALAPVPSGRRWRPPSLLSPQRLEEELRLHKCSTRECIEQYYLDKLKQVRGPGVGTWPHP